MEKMGRNIISSIDRSRLNDIIQRIVLGNIDEKSQADIILILNDVLKNGNISINNEFPEINTLLYVLDTIEYDNNVIDILSTELRNRIIRENILPNTDDKVYNDDVRSLGERRRVTPVNGNFELPPIGQTAIIFSKRDIPGSKLRDVERIEIDHDGYVIRVLDRFREYNNKAVTDEEDLVYNGLLDDVLSFDDLHEDMKNSDEDSNAKEDTCDGNCDGCDTREEDHHE